MVEISVALMLEPIMNGTDSGERTDEKIAKKRTGAEGVVDLTFQGTLTSAGSLRCHACELASVRYIRHWVQREMISSGTRDKKCSLRTCS